MRLPITIDPRYHDAVLFDLDSALASNVPLFVATVDLARKLQGIGVAAAAYSSSPQCRQALKAAGIDDLFGICIDGIPAIAGRLKRLTPQSFWKSLADSASGRNGVSSWRTPTPAWRLPATADSGSSSASTGPDVPTTWPATEPTWCSATWPMSPFARVTSGYRSSRTH